MNFITVEDMSSLLKYEYDHVVIDSTISPTKLTNINRNIKELRIYETRSLAEIKDINMDKLALYHAVIENSFGKNVVIDRIRLVDCDLYDLNNLKANELQLSFCNIKNCNLVEPFKKVPAYIRECFFNNKVYNNSGELIRDMRVMHETTPEAQELFGDFL